MNLRSKQKYSYLYKDTLCTSMHAYVYKWYPRDHAGTLGIFLHPFGYWASPSPWVTADILVFFIIAGPSTPPIPSLTQHPQYQMTYPTGLNFIFLRYLLISEKNSCWEHIIPKLGLPIRILTQSLKGSGILLPREVPPHAASRFPQSWEQVPPAFLVDIPFFQVDILVQVRSYPELPKNQAEKNTNVGQCHTSFSAEFRCASCSHSHLIRWTIFWKKVPGEPRIDQIDKLHKMHVPRIQGHAFSGNQKCLQQAHRPQGACRNLKIDETWQTIPI